MYDDILSYGILGPLLEQKTDSVLNHFETKLE